MLRTLLVSAAFVASCAEARAPSCDPATIGYAPSRLGIDYRDRLPAPLAEIFAMGEVERLAALATDPAGLTGPQRTALRREWRALIDGLFAGTLPDTFTGSPDEVSMDFPRLVTPIMLARLKACGPDADARLAYLADVRLNSVAGDSE